MADTEQANASLIVLIERWWMMVIRGIAAILAGVVAVALPGTSLTALVLVFGAYAVVNGVLALLHALRGGRARTTPWGWLAFEGVVGVGVGVLAVIYPGLTFLALLVLTTVWAFSTSIAQVASAISLRRVIRHEWLLGASGTLSAAFTVALFVLPVAGVPALAWVFCAYAVPDGVLLIALGLRLFDLRGRPSAGGRASRLRSLET